MRGIGKGDKREREKVEIRALQQTHGLDHRITTPRVSMSGPRSEDSGQVPTVTSHRTTVSTTDDLTILLLTSGM